MNNISISEDDPDGLMSPGYQNTSAMDNSRSFMMPELVGGLGAGLGLGKFASP